MSSRPIMQCLDRAQKDVVKLTKHTRSALTHCITSKELHMYYTSESNSNDYISTFFSVTDYQGQLVIDTFHILYYYDDTSLTQRYTPLSLRTVTSYPRVKRLQLVFFQPLDSAKPVPLAEFRWIGDTGTGKALGRITDSHCVSIRKETIAMLRKKAPKEPSQSVPGRHADRTQLSGRVKAARAGESPPKQADGCRKQLGPPPTPVCPALRSPILFPESYGSHFATSLPTLFNSTRGCSPWKT
ncbi:hypothetical protein Tco_0280985 [Tanacetum coccineum]